MIAARFCSPALKNWWRPKERRNLIRLLDVIFSPNNLIYNGGLHVFYKNIEKFRSLRMFLNFWDLSQNMFLFLHFSTIFMPIPKKLHVLESTKPKNVLSMFLRFWASKPYVLMYFVLI